LKYGNSNRLTPFGKGQQQTALDGLCKIHKNGMSTFKERLITEKSELDEKRGKLAAFQNSEAFKKIDPVQMTLLNIQAQAMLTYSQCLTERLAWLSPPESES
jgi:hypothetical protein